jgi:ankyrin repeat protein
LLEKGANPNARGTNEFSTLHMVRDPAIVPILIAAGADPKGTDNTGRTPLQAAVEEERMDVVQALLEAGEELDLKCAIALGKQDLARELVLREPSLARDSSSTQWHPWLSLIADPLHQAASMGDVELVSLLLDCGAEEGPEPRVVINFSGDLTALNYAVWGDHLDVARLLLDRGADPNTGGTYKFEGSLLDATVQAGSPEMVELLLGHGAKSGRCDPPLHMATWLGRTETVQVLLEHGMSPDELHDGATPLQLACLGRHPTIARYLLDHGASLEVHSAAALGLIEELRTQLVGNRQALEQPEGTALWTPLMYAVWAQQRGAVEVLLDLGADPNWQAPEGAWDGQGHAESSGYLTHWRLPFEDPFGAGGRGMTALELAVRTDQVETASRLLAARATVYPYLLVLALRSPARAFELSSLLLEHGADPDDPASHPDPLFVLAWSKDSARLIRLLNEHGANLERKDVEGRSLLFHCVEAGNSEAAHYLLEQDVEVDFASACGLGLVERMKDMLTANPDLATAPTDMEYWPSPMSLAAARGQLGSVRILYEHGAPVDGSGNEDPLPLAVRNGHSEVAEYLIEQGASPTMRVGWGWETLLHLAAVSDSIPTIHALLEHGLDPTAIDGMRMTPLHTAAGKGRTNSVRALLSAGARTDARDYQGETPLHAAATSFEGDTLSEVQLLLEAGADKEAKDFSGRTPLALMPRIRRVFGEPAWREHVAELLRGSSDGR